METVVKTIHKTIYYDDTDAGGVVYHANYLRYMDHARSEYINEIGFDFHTLQEKQNMSYVVANVNINYRKPSRLGDNINITAEIKNLGKTSLQFYQTVSVGSELCAEADVTVVIVSLDTMKPTKIPAVIQEALMYAK